MPKFVVAYVWEEFPKYDRVQQVGRTLKYYKGEVVVAEIGCPEVGLTFEVAFPRHLALEFTDLDATPESAMERIRQQIPNHIVMMTAALVPP